jgi:hypothetical protein
MGDVHRAKLKIKGLLEIKARMLRRSTGDQNQAQTFGINTGSSNLCEHLVGSHQNEWVKKCLEWGLTIKGEDGLSAKAVYEVEQLGGSLTNPPVSSNDRPQFGREAFVDSFIEWIVADDQVCVACLTSFCRD